MPVSRIVPYADGGNVAASRDFYVEMLGLEVTMEDPVLGLASPANANAQVMIPPAGMENLLKPDFAGALRGDADGDARSRRLHPGPAAARPGTGRAVGAGAPSQGALDRHPMEAYPNGTPELIEGLDAVLGDFWR